MGKKCENRGKCERKRRKEKKINEIEANMIKYILIQKW
jgi:hypothetical protein